MTTSTKSGDTKVFNISKFGLIVAECKRMSDVIRLFPNKTDEWRPIETAPMYQIVRIKLKDGTESLGYQANYYLNYWTMPVINERPYGNQGPRWESHTCEPAHWKPL